MNEKIKTVQHSWEFESDVAKAKGFIFPDENIGSSAHYPKGRVLHSPQVQAQRLIAFFPNLRAEPMAYNVLPTEDFDGFIVIPNFLRIGLSYEQATETLLKFLALKRKNFFNCREGELGSDYLRPIERTRKALETLGSKCNNFIVFPAQLGKRHLGKSARQAHMDLVGAEFGLGPFEIASFLLTHPQWLSAETDLGIDCIGCEYGPYQHGFYKYILFFYYFKKHLKFEERWCGCPDARFGPATGFLL